MDMNQYLSMFIDESREHLQSINENLLRLEESQEDLSFVQAIFRSAHTLKGMSATMGFEDMAALTHQMESVLDLVRNQKLEMSVFIFDALFRSTDSLESMVQDIMQGGTGRADVKENVTILKSIVSGDYIKENADGKDKSGHLPAHIDEFQFAIMHQLIESGHNVFRVEVELEENCILKAARAYMVFKALEGSGEIVKSSPTVEEIEQERFDRTFSVYYISQVEESELCRIIGNVSEIESVNVIGLTSDSLKELMVGQENTQNTMVTVADTQVVEQSRGKAEPSAKAAPPPGNALPATRTIRVDIERLDALMNLFSELLLDRVRLEQLASEIRRTELTETVEHMSRVSNDLQNVVMKLRMVSVDNVFNRFPRMIRDVAKSIGKKLELVITGADTEMDRIIVDEIGDPLVHMLRNSADHGIEQLAARVAAGKLETGTIQLRAFHSGNQVFIEIEDDGAGINGEKVLNRAMQQGLVTQDQASRMSEHEIYQLLFASGFSTAEQISDLSGRGVGLDVVKTKIESLGGRVQVDSKRGEGTTFSVQLPLTLTIITAMLIQIGPERYAIPLTTIVETACVRKDQLRYVSGMRMMEFRKNIIPVISLHDILQIPQTELEIAETIKIIVVRKGEKLFAIPVDDFLGQQEIVLKSLGKYLTNIIAISGATILGDGQVALIVDTNALIN
ncbi:two-component system chemotaxis sensor kinase CheA [Paenibacillus taihuensis]|uniref:Chemotaxis protein CheA n=1 Tax=Paenibacillus taihuensis TaxID=1156355 RepID=A0A3D9RHD6_9BACL|nr:chemotaxis protein CheA [Paenibacillus taihuensis]REE77728.1 two-component system chemotaxis sensor kinase CheA [Paenibacillus taihuensis]